METNITTQPQKKDMAAIFKIITFLALTVFLHFLYDFTKYQVFSIISAIDESIFEHMKIIFYAYFFTNIIEYLIYHKEIYNIKNYIYSRIFSLIFLPWVMILLYYIAPVIYGQMPSPLLEVVYAIIITILVGISTEIIRKNIEDIELKKNLIILTTILFFLTIFLFASFTHKKPIYDLFAVPKTNYLTEQGV